MARNSLHFLKFGSQAIRRGFGKLSSAAPTEDLLLRAINRVLTSPGPVPWTLP
jgi:hypothetical protein